MKESYYRPSGKIAGTYWLWLLLFLVVSSPILAVVYIYGVHYIPFIYLTIFLAVGCGALLGLIVGFAAKKGRARNPGTVTASALVAALILKYVQWCVYVPLILDEVYELYESWYGFTLSFGEQLIEALYILPDPLYLLDWALTINEYGVWGFSSNGGAVGDSVTGVMLFIIWLGEFAIIALMAVLVARRQPKYPFSEEANAWYISQKKTIEIDVAADFVGLKTLLESGNIEKLLELVAAGQSDEANFMRLRFFTSPQPSHAEAVYMNIEHCSVDKKKRAKSQVLAKYLTLSPANAAAITAAGESVIGDQASELSQ